MTRIPDQYSDLIEESSDSELLRCISDLDAQFSRLTMLPEQDTTIRRSLRGHAADLRTQPVAPRRRLRLPVLKLAKSRVRLVSTALAMLVALGGGFHLRDQAATPVSAQVLLHRAAASIQKVDRSHAIHEIAIIHSSAISVANGSTHAGQYTVGLGIIGHTGPVPDVTLDQWSQYASDGALARYDGRVTSLPDGILLSHVVMVGLDVDAYMAATNTSEFIHGGATQMQQEPLSRPGSVLTLLSAGEVGLRQLLLQAQQGTQARYLGQQVLDGFTVDVVEVTRDLPISGTAPDRSVVPSRLVFTLFIDANTYVIRQVDSQAVNLEGRTIDSTVLQVVKRDIVTTSALPASVFTFTSPPDACVVAIRFPKPRGTVSSAACVGRP